MPAEAGTARTGDFDGVLDSMRVRVRQLVLVPDEVVRDPEGERLDDERYRAYERERLRERARWDEVHQQNSREKRMSTGWLTFLVLLAVLGIIWLVYATWPESASFGVAGEKAAVTDVTDLVMKCRPVSQDWTPERSISTFDCK